MRAAAVAYRDNRGKGGGGDYSGECGDTGDYTRGGSVGDSEGGDMPQGAIVTSSSAAVGCTATQLSKSALVAPIFIATAKPCSASSQPIPAVHRKWCGCAVAVN